MRSGEFIEGSSRRPSLGPYNSCHAPDSWLPNEKSINLLRILRGQKALINLRMHLYGGFILSGVFGNRRLLVPIGWIRGIRFGHLTIATPRL